MNVSLRSRRAVGAAVLVGFLALGAVFAQAVTPQGMLARLFNAPLVAEEFAPSVLAVASVTQLQGIVSQYSQALGKLQSVQPATAANQFTLVFEKGTATAYIVLDAQGQIIGLQFGAPALTGGLNPAVKAFSGLPGTVSLLVMKDGQEVVAQNADTPLAVGSSFKLAVLAALQDQVQAGKRTWSDVVPLQVANKSLPTGILQSWPDGTPLTLATLATLMISISDNTAADTLLNLVGRAAVEKYAPHQPVFASTTEVFRLHDPANAALLAKYRAADANTQRAILTQLDAQPRPNVQGVAGWSTMLDVEWHFTARELCGLMARVQALPLMSVNPGVANPADWARVTYKGGSDLGVLNFTTGLFTKDGHSYCVSVTQNDPQTNPDESKLVALTASLIAALK